MVPSEETRGKDEEAKLELRFYSNLQERVNEKLGRLQFLQRKNF